MQSSDEVGAYGLTRLIPVKSDYAGSDELYVAEAMARRALALEWKRSPEPGRRPPEFEGERTAQCDLHAGLACRRFALGQHHRSPGLITTSESVGLLR